MVPVVLVLGLLAAFAAYARTFTAPLQGPVPRLCPIGLPEGDKASVRRLRLAVMTPGAESLGR